MLKTITPRHRDIMRRLIVAQSPKEIADELGMSPATIRNLLKDPVFATELLEMEKEANRKLFDSEERLAAVETIKRASDEAAQLCRNVINDKVEGAEGISMELRVKSAWDILDRAGHGKVEKKATLDLTSLILEAAKQRDGSSDQRN